MDSILTPWEELDDVSLGAEFTFAQVQYQMMLEYSPTHRPLNYNVRLSKVRKRVEALEVIAKQRGLCCS